LQYDWDGDGSVQDPPAARATFGIYKGSEQIIYLRETTWH
jgi:MSHA biogenesis protein MshQ